MTGSMLVAMNPAVENLHKSRESMGFQREHFERGSQICHRCMMPQLYVYIYIFIYREREIPVHISPAKRWVKKETSINRCSSDKRCNPH